MDTTYLSNYEAKRITAAQFPDLIKDHDYIMNALGPAAASRDIYDALCDRYEEFTDVLIGDTVQTKLMPFHDNAKLSQMRGHINYEGWYYFGPARIPAGARMSDFRPVMTEDCTQHITEKATVFTVSVTPPNEQGMCNMSVCNFFHKKLIERGRQDGKLRLVVAEMNDQMPIVCGDNWISMDDIDFFYEKSVALPCLPAAVPSEQENAIRNNALSMIADGDCIQIGLGTITNAIAAEIAGNFKDLGINSEMLPCGIDDMVASGAVTNLNRVNHKGVSTATLLLGNQKLYDYCEENENVQLFCCDYINHPRTIAENPQVCAVNMALQVDLSGQISAESMGYRQVSGTGGQLDFAIGAHWSKGGKSLCLITSGRTLKDGNFASSIVPSLPAGTTVSVPRMYADYVVTEFGVASLRNKSCRERAQELIAVAHPEVREELKAAALKNWWPDEAADFNY